MLMIIEVGARVFEAPSVAADKFHFNSNENKEIEGTVVYVNKKHRYYTVEFKAPGGKFRESFKFRKKKKVNADG